jgi:hypothetical protein
VFVILKMRSLAVQAQVQEKNAQFHAHLEQLRLEAEHEIRSAVGDLQAENEQLRQHIQQQLQQQQQQDEERQQQMTENSRLKSEVLALKTRLQLSEGEEMRQHVTTFEQARSSVKAVPVWFLTRDAERAARARQAAPAVCRATLQFFECPVVFAISPAFQARGRDGACSAGGRRAAAHE